MEIESLLHQNPQHEPEVNTKKLWLYCRRKETQIGSPGFLCSPSQWDMALFLLILVLEFIGLWLFYKYVGNLVFAISFFVADITYAVSAHLVYGRISLTKNRIFLLHQRVKIYVAKNGQRTLSVSAAVQARKERWRLFRLKGYALFFYIMIALLGLFKIGGFIANWPGRDPINSISVTICLTYIVVAALQIYSTGYFTFTSLFNLMVKLNLRTHRDKPGRLYARIDAGAVTDHLYEGIDIHAMLLLDPRFEDLGYMQKNRESLPNFCNCTVRNHFLHNNRLYLYGVVTDEDLNAFVNFHANLVAERQILGILLLDLQLEKGILNGGRDLYTEPIPFPAGNIAGPGAIDRAATLRTVYSVARVANDLFENRKERTGRNWEYVWMLEELVQQHDADLPAVLQPVHGALTRSEDQLRVTVDFGAIAAGKTLLLSVYAKNLAEPGVRGIASPPFPIRIIS